MTTNFTIQNPATSANKLNVEQSGNTNQVGFIEPGDSLSVAVHTGNTVTISEGEAASTGPGTPGSAKVGR